jgi:hypothetical protein
MKPVREAKARSRAVVPLKKKKKKMFDKYVSVEEIIWIQERRSNRRMEKIT